MDDDMEHMTAEEMQRFLVLEAEEGKTELEAYRILARILGIEFPQNSTKDKEAPTESEGMTDLQFKDFLRGLVNDLERVKAAGVSNAAAGEIDTLLGRFAKSLEG